MLPRAIRLSALGAALLIGAGAAEAEACGWFGGGWGAFRPLTWGSSYRPWGAFYGGGYGAYWGGSSGCCTPCGTGCGPCGVGGCATGACGSTSFYGGDCSNCGAGDSNYSSGYSPSTEPEPDPMGTRGTNRPPATGPESDDFRGEGEYGTERDIRNNSAPMTPTGNEDRSSIPMPPANRSSIPEPNRSSIPEPNRSSIPNPNRSSIPMGTEPRPMTNDPFNGAEDAELWRETPAPQEPTDGAGAAPGALPPVTGGPEIQRVQPLDLSEPVASRYQVQRQRISVRAVYSIPAVARTVVGPNEGWEPVVDQARVASSR